MKSDQNIKLSSQHLRTFAKPIVILFGTLIALGVVANILVDNPYAHRIIRVAINEKVNQYSNLNLDFKALNIRVMPMELNLYGFNLFVKDEKGKDQLISSASQIHTRLSLFSLFLGTPKLAIVEATDLKLNMEALSKVKFNVESSSEKKSEQDFTWPPDFVVPLSEISLRNASFSYDAPAKTKDDTSLNIIVEGLDIESDIDDWDDLVVGVNMTSLSLAMDGREVFQRAKFSSELILDEDAFSIDNIRLDSSLLNTNGHIESIVVREKKVFKKIESRGDLEFSGDLALMDKLFDLPGTDGPAKGRMILDSKFALDGSEDFKLKVDLEGGVEKGKIYDFKLYNSKGRLAIDTEKIVFENIDVIVDQDSVGVARGELRFDDEMGFDFSFSPEKLRLTSLLTALQLDFEEIDAALTADKYHIKGKSFPFQLSASGTVKLDDIAVNGVHSEKDWMNSPKCFVELNMMTTSEYINFDTTSADCFTHATWPSKKWLEGEEGRNAADDLSKLQVAGGIDYDGKQSRTLNISTTDFDLRLANYFTGLRQTGRSNVDVSIFPEKQDFKIAGVVDAKLVQVEDVPIGDIKAKFEFINSKISIRDYVSKLDATNEIKISSFNIEFNEKLPFSIDVIASRIPASMIQPLMNNFTPKDSPFSFSSEFITAKIEGELLKPFEYRGRLNGLLRNGETKKDQIFESLRFDLQSEQSEVLLKYFSYQVGDLVINSTGKMSKMSKEDAKVSTPDHWEKLGLSFANHLKLNIGTTSKLIQLDEEKPSNDAKLSQNLHFLPIAGPMLHDLGIDGSLSLNGTFEGNFETMSGTLQLGIHNFTYLQSELAPVNVEAFLQGKKLDTIIRHSGNALTGRMSLDLSDDKWPYNIYLKATRLDIRSFAPLPFHSDPRNYAYLTASLNLQGELESWWNSTGDIEVGDLQVNYTADFTSDGRRVELRLNEPINVLIDNNGWNIKDNKRFRLSGDFLNFSLGTGENNPPESIDLDYTGSFDLAGVELLSNRIESSTGKIIFNGFVKGDVKDPKFSMRVFNEKVRTNKVSIGLVDLRPSFDDIDFDMTIDREKVMLNRLVAKKGSGQMSAVGQVSLDPDENSDSQIDVTFEDAKLVFPAPVVKLVEASISGNLFIKNALPPYEVTGNIEIDRGRTVGEIDPRKEIIEALRQRDYSTSSGNLNPFLDLNINVTADNSLIINNRNMQATLSSDLRISGSEVQPIVLGQVEINKGKFIYKRDFNLTQGLITFDDPVKLDPKLDINATAEAQNYRVFIAVSGRASEPVVDLSTDPATRDDGTAITKLDIITLLSTGNLPDVNRNDISSQTVAQTEALNIFAGQLEEPVEKLFDLAGQKVVREVYIDTYAISGGRPLARLNMPLNLGKNWDMIFRVDQESWRLSSEYSLHENISILGSFDGRSEVEVNDTGQTSSGDTGVDVKFRFSFP